MAAPALPTPPARKVVAVLPLIVLLVKLKVESLLFQIAPPWKPVAVLLLNVLPVTVSVPKELLARPADFEAVLPVTLLSTRVNWPPLLEMPPPESALLPVTLLAISVNWPALWMPPPDPTAELPLTTLLIMVNVAVV